MPRGQPGMARERLIDWAVSLRPVDYAGAVRAMEARARLIADGRAPELIWLLEHPPVYTAGTTAREADLLDAQRFPVHRTGRGGKLTYHGPGQRVAYVMLDVKHRVSDVRAFVRAMEAWLIETLASLGVSGETRPGRVGIWVRRPVAGDEREDKLAAIGLRISRGVSLHGLSLNVHPDLEHYRGIVPCGISDHGVTSLADLGMPTTLEAVDNILRRCFERQFGPTRDVAAPRDDAAPSPSADLVEHRS